MDTIVVLSNDYVVKICNSDRSGLDASVVQCNRIIQNLRLFFDPWVHSVFKVLASYGPQLGKCVGRDGLSEPLQSEVVSQLHRIGMCCEF